MTVALIMCGEVPPKPATTMVNNSARLARTGTELAVFPVGSGAIQCSPADSARSIVLPISVRSLNERARAWGCEAQAKEIRIRKHLERCVYKIEWLKMCDSCQRVTTNHVCVSIHAANSGCVETGRA